MKNLKMALFLLLLSPSICFATTANSAGFNWGGVIGSAIAAGIIGVAVWAEQLKNKDGQNKNLLKKQIKAPRLAKFFKNAAVLLSLYVVYSFISTLLVPDKQINDIVKYGPGGITQDMGGSRFILTIALIILTVFIYKKLTSNKDASKA